MDFASEAQSHLYRALKRALQQKLGYKGDLFVEDYKFVDWFEPDTPSRNATAAVFGQAPNSYATACIAVVSANGEHGANLVNKFRAVGAPVSIRASRDRLLFKPLVVCRCGIVGERLGCSA